MVGRNVKARDYQAEVPLELLPDGKVWKLVWKDEWSLQVDWVYAAKMYSDSGYEQSLYCAPLAAAALYVIG
eukprot:COSAG02_NODE_4187_length_5649_cov_4.270811_5_plen_71_part_00